MNLDLKRALKRLAASWGMTLSMLLVLFLGVAANVLLLEGVRQRLDLTPSYRDPGAVLLLKPGVRGQASAWQPMSEPQRADLAMQARTLSDVVAVRDRQWILRREGEALPVSGAEVSLGGLGLLGVPFCLGQDAGDPDGMLISHRWWMEAFGGDPSVVGRSVWIAGRARTVRGVLAQGVRLPWMLGNAEVFLPVRLDPVEQSRQTRSMWLLARRRAGVDMGQVRSELAGLTRSLATPDQLGEGWTLGAVTVVEESRALQLPGAFLTALAAGLLLLLVCANVAGLGLAKVERRARESALCSALGASRRRLLAVPLLEGSLLCFGAAGLAWLVLPWVAPHVPGLGGAFRLSMQTGVIALGLGFLAVLLVGLLPAWRGSRVDLRHHLVQGGQVSGRQGWRKALVVAQVALCTLLLAGTALATRSLSDLEGLDMGLEPRGVQMALVNLRNPVDAGTQARLRAGLLGMPGVQAAGFASAPPLYNRMDQERIWAEGEDVPGRMASLEEVDPGYFGTLGIALKAGRFYEATAQDACLVSESLARTFWPGQEALGRWISLQGPGGRRLTVVGVVADHRHNSRSRGPVPQCFVPMDPSRAGLTLLVRSGLGTTDFQAQLKRTLAVSAPGAQVLEVMGLQSVADRALAGPRTLRVLLGALSLVAFLLAGIGMHGLAVSLAEQRRREFGLRHALGAPRTRILAATFRDGARQTALGLGIGLGLALAGGLLLRSRVEGLALPNLPSLLLIALLMSGLTLAAGLMPALRALAIPPAEALRDDA